MNSFKKLFLSYVYMSSQKNVNSVSMRNTLKIKSHVYDLVLMSGKK
jgi:hypothetical protein